MFAHGGMLIFWCLMVINTPLKVLNGHYSQGGLELARSDFLLGVQVDVLDFMRFAPSLKIKSDLLRFGQMPECGDLAVPAL